jgi:hypothetical protein
LRNSRLDHDWRRLALADQDQSRYPARIRVVAQLVRQFIERLLIRVAHGRRSAGDPPIDALGCGMKQQRRKKKRGGRGESPSHPGQPTHLKHPWHDSLSQLRRRRGGAVGTQALFDTIVFRHLILTSSAARTLSIA